MINKKNKREIKDEFRAYLVKNSKFTLEENYPIIEDWMVANEIPTQLVQWNRKIDVRDAQSTTICFYCDDQYFRSILNNPKRYVKILKKYKSVVGLDYSPYDDMPVIVQKYNIYLNLAITSFFAKNGIKIIPNVRLGNDMTLSSLEAYPKHKIIAIGSNGFVKKLSYKTIFVDQFKKIIDSLQPSDICIYGPVLPEMEDYANLKNVKLHRFDSYTMQQNKIDKKLKRGAYERK